MSNILTAIKMRVEPVRTLAFGAIGAAYAAIGTGFANPCRILYVQNLTDVTLMFSLDGVSDAFPLVSNGFVILDLTTNKSQAAGCFFVTGTTVYVKEIGTPTMNGVYVSSFYGSAT